MEAAATGKRSGRRAGVSPGDAGTEEPGGGRRGERTAVVRESGAGEGRFAGSVDVSRDRDILARLTVRGADAAAQPRVYAGGDCVARDRDWREHGDFQRGGCDSAEVAASKKSGGVADCPIDGRAG